VGPLYIHNVIYEQKVDSGNINCESTSIRAHDMSCAGKVGTANDAGLPNTTSKLHRMATTHTAHFRSCCIVMLKHVALLADNVDSPSIHSIHSEST
jgi:hypothetical protein